MYKKLVTCLESVRKKIDFKPEVALILGSGLGDFADGIKIEQTIDYTEIEGFPVSTVKGHKGRFVFGYVEDTPVVIMHDHRSYYNRSSKPTDWTEYRGAWNEIPGYERSV